MPRPLASCQWETVMDVVFRNGEYFRVTPSGEQKIGSPEDVLGKPKMAEIRKAAEEAAKEAEE